MTNDAEREIKIRQTYRGLRGDMPPFGDVLTLLRLLDEARAEIARLNIQPAPWSMGVRDWPAGTS